MKTEDIKKMAQAWNQVQEAKKKKLDPVGKADADIDNDGDVDSSDKYLHNRRKAIKKAMSKDSKGTETETIVSEEMTDAQKKKREEIVLSMKDKTDEFKKKYGERWKDVMYATATKMAMKEEVEELDEISKKTLGSYVKKAAGDLQKSAGKSGYASGKGVNKAEYDRQTDRAEKRKAGIRKAVDKLTKEEFNLDEANAPKGTHTPNNGSDPDQGLSPSAKKEKARKTPISTEVDEPKVNAMNFKTFRNMTKAAPKRNNDQTIGDKTMPKNDGK